MLHELDFINVLLLMNLLIIFQQVDQWDVNWGEHPEEIQPEEVTDWCVHWRRQFHHSILQEGKNQNKFSTLSQAYWA